MSRWTQEQIDERAARMPDIVEFVDENEQKIANIEPLVLSPEDKRLYAEACLERNCELAEFIRYAIAEAARRDVKQTVVTEAEEGQRVAPEPFEQQSQETQEFIAQARTAIDELDSEPSPAEIIQEQKDKEQ